MKYIFLQSESCWKNLGFNGRCIRLLTNLLPLLVTLGNRLVVALCLCYLVKFSADDLAMFQQFQLCANKCSATEKSKFRVLQVFSAL